MNSLIVLNGGDELRPEEAIIRLLNKVEELVDLSADQQNQIDRLTERVQWFECQGL